MLIPRPGWVTENTPISMVFEMVHESKTRMHLEIRKIALNYDFPFLR